MLLNLAPLTLEAKQIYSAAYTQFFKDKKKIEEESLPTATLVINRGPGEVQVINDCVITGRTTKGLYLQKDEPTQRFHEWFPFQSKHITINLHQ